MAKWIHYTLDSLKEFIETLVCERGYELEVIDEGSLGLGLRALIPPTDRQYTYIIREEYLNGWASINKMIKCRKLPKWWYKAAERAEAEREQAEADYAAWKAKLDSYAA